MAISIKLEDTTYINLINIAKENESIDDVINKLLIKYQEDEN